MNMIYYSNRNTGNKVRRAKLGQNYIIPVLLSHNMICILLLNAFYRRVCTFSILYHTVSTVELLFEYQEKAGKLYNLKCYLCHFLYFSHLRLPIMEFWNLVWHSIVLFKTMSRKMNCRYTQAFSYENSWLRIVHVSATFDYSIDWVIVSWL